MLFPAGRGSRVPIRAITAPTASHHRAHAGAPHKMAGFTPGLTTTDGVYTTASARCRGDMTARFRAHGARGFRRSTSRCSRRARRPAARRHGRERSQRRRGAQRAGRSLGLKGIETLEQLAEVKRIIVEVATDAAVLNADDPLVLKMSGYTEAKNI